MEGLEERLHYILDSPGREYGGFHHELVQTAKMAMTLLNNTRNVRERLFEVRRKIAGFRRSLEELDTEVAILMESLPIKGADLGEP